MKKKIFLLSALMGFAGSAMAQLSVYAGGQVGVGTGSNSTTVKLSAEGKVIGTKRTLTK